MTNFRLRFCTALFALPALSALAGCSELDNCPDALDDDITIDRPEGAHLDELVYESSAGWEDFDPYPAKTSLRFKHGLGVVPYAWESFVSFTKQATNGNGGGSATEAAGNEAVLECVDSYEIVITNDTCEESFYVKLVAWGFSDGVAGDDTCSKKK